VVVGQDKIDSRSPELFQEGGGVGGVVVRKTKAIRLSFPSTEFGNLEIK